MATHLCTEAVRKCFSLCFTRPFEIRANLVISNAEIKRLRRLHQKKYRDDERLFLAEGTKLMEEMARAGVEPAGVWATQSLEGSLPFEIERISEEQMRKISTLSTPPGVLAVVPYADKQLGTPWQDWALYLSGVSDPGNMGTLLRIADWFGLGAVFCSPACVDVYNPKVVQASMGAVFRVPFQQKCDSGWLKNIADKGIPVVSAEMQGTPIQDFQWPKSGLLVMGSESHGVEDEIAALVNERVTIPRVGEAESLNVAVAAGIICSRLPLSGR